MSQSEFHDVIVSVEPILKAVQDKIRAEPDCNERRVWRAILDTLDTAYLHGKDAEATLMAGAVAAILDGRTDEAIGVLKAGLAGKPKPPAPRVVAAPSRN